MKYWATCISETNPQLNSKIFPATDLKFRLSRDQKQIFPSLRPTTNEPTLLYRRDQFKNSQFNTVSINPN